MGVDKVALEERADVGWKDASKKMESWERSGALSGRRLMIAAATMSAGKSDTIAE